MEKKQIISKDVINSEKIINNINNNPSESINEITRVMIENVQRVQLNDMNIKLAVDICSQLKAASNNIFLSWGMKGNKTQKKIR